jgi:hypothetical protein
MDGGFGGANVPIGLGLGSEQEGEELQPIDTERLILYSRGAGDKGG